MNTRNVFEHWEKEEAGHNAISDLPWLTENDISTQAKQEYEYLIRYPKKLKRMLWSKPDVLDRYRMHEYPILDISNPFSCTYAFLNYDRINVAVSLSFFNT